MRQLKKAVFQGLLLLIVTGPVAAGDLYFGAKTGKAVVDDSSVSKDATNTGVLIGYELGVVLGDLAVEGEYTTTTGDGEITGGAKLSFDTMAAYLAFRTAGPIYFKARGGFLQFDNDGNTDSGPSYGIGLGFGIGITQLELEYTQSSLDTNVAYVSLGIQF